ncbi:MAG: S41 family peptidase, partial [Candidatus Pacebacteria bacterium]|nr:S41 family peptidase [Candidatus Paceibacterota bacterium]
VNVNNNKVYSQNNNAIVLDSTNNIIANIKSIIDDRFINSKSSSTLPNSQDLQDGVISGFVSAYNDPYTQYFNPNVAKTFNQTISGSFGGIGIEITHKNGNITIVSPLKNTPSYKAGLKAGDIILSVDDISIDNQSTDIVITKIRGEVGTSVKIKIYRSETKETKDFTITRDIIKVPVVDSKIVGDYFVISLYTFTTDSPELFKKEMIKFLQSGKTNLVLDLRGNPGGSVDSAILISSYFLNNGDTIFQEIGKNKVVRLNNAFDLKVFDITKYKLYVLVDGGSASASEIVAGALQEHGLAYVYGNKTFGKGSVQELVPLSGGSYLKVTIAN